MRLLDLFCGAGGAAMGYSRAGFTEIVGVDLRPMPRYPFEFVQGDALDYLREHGHEFDAIHASPPCQGYSVTEPMTRAVRNVKQYPLLVEDVRAMLQATGKPYVIENVKGAPLRDPLRLKGAVFGLGVIRERLFEINPPLFFRPPPGHQPGRTAKHGEYERGQHGLVCVAGNNFEPGIASRAMGIDWMTRDELAEAIPPAYTEYIGRHLIQVVTDYTR